jgi:hypothetical protein
MPTAARAQKASNSAYEITQNHRGPVGIPASAPPRSSAEIKHPPSGKLLYQRGRITTSPTQRPILSMRHPEHALHTAKK